MQKTKIQWCDATWNPWLGCTKVHTGCANCYAEAMMDKRLHKVQWGPNGTRQKTSESYWKKPLAWDKKAAKEGKRLRVFPSLCDPFEDWEGPIVNGRGEKLLYHLGHGAGPWKGMGRLAQGATMSRLRSDFFELIDATPHIDWILLTKRPENIWRMWPPAGDGVECEDHGALYDASQLRDNVHLYYSASDQETLEAGIDGLGECRNLTRVSGLSLEPLLGPIDLSGCMEPHVESIGNGHEGGSFLSSIIIGGESGPGARPCNIDWIRSLVQQCKEAGVKCFVKQLGANLVGYDYECWKCGSTDWGCFDHIPGTRYPTKNCNICEADSDRCRDPKGGNPKEWPEELRVREMV